MTGLAWTVLAAAAALAAAVAGHHLSRHLGRRRAAKEQAARSLIARLRAQGQLALDPEAAFLRTLAQHPELHDLTKDT